MADAADAEGARGGCAFFSGPAVHVVAATTVAAAVAVFVALSASAPRSAWSWSSLAGIPDSGAVATPRLSAVLLAADSAFVVLYVLAGWLTFRSTWSNAERVESVDPARYGAFARRMAGWGSIGFSYVAIAGLADLIENALTNAVRLNPQEQGSMLLMATTAAAWSKWISLVPGLGALLVTSVATATRRHDLCHRDPVEGPIWSGGRNRHPPPFVVQGRRVGVSLSGGGIRSAAFSLGALQAVSESKLNPINYVTSVSGGGYMAAAWASMSGDEAAAPFKRRSPEERWVRHHTDYLVSSGGVVIGAVTAMLGGFLLNLLLIILLFQTLAHPLGWAISSAHPELRAKTPIVTIGSQPEATVLWAERVAGVEATKTDGTVGNPLAVPYLIEIGLSDADVRMAASVDDTPRPERLQFDVVPGLIVETPSGLSIARQPHMTPSSDRPPVKVARQPRLELEDPLNPLAAQGRLSRTSPRAVEELLRIHDPVLRQETGTLGRENIAAPTWIWIVLGSLTLIAIALWLADVSLRHESGLLAGSNRLAAGVAKLVVGAFLFLVGLPWLGTALPAWLRNFPGYDASSTGWGALSAFVAAAATMIWKLRGRLSGRIPWLRRFRGRPQVFDAVTGLAIVAVLVVVFVAFVDIATANGPNGRLEGIHDRWMWDGPDWARWAGATGLLSVLLAVPVSAHAWSLYTFYRSRLGEAYMLERIDEPHSDDSADLPSAATYRVSPLRGSKVHGWQWADPRSPSARSAAKLDEKVFDPRRVTSLATAANPKVSVPSPDSRPDVGRIEEWVVCAAVNIRGSGEAAPGRAAGSFSFSKSWVGGPEVGWIKTSLYLQHLSKSRLRDVSVPSTVTISGAAFSPAMGKMSKPWQGRLLALLNLRLGVWVPNPMTVRQGRHYGGLRAPNAMWYLRELIGWFDRTAPYVYLTDGGHWENLGLVELLRRGCTEIWMVSAAGDGLSSFETLAQALALAHEEIGVEFDGLELESLRPTEKPAADGPRRVLRDGAATATAPSSFVRGRFQYGDGTRGSITVIEAALVGNLPWDVHSYAERNDDFPDISTGWQLMNHRDFEAYRMLGYTQTTEALATDDLVVMRTT